VKIQSGRTVIAGKEQVVVQNDFEVSSGAELYIGN